MFRNRVERSETRAAKTGTMRNDKLESEATDVRVLFEVSADQVGTPPSFTFNIDWILCQCILACKGQSHPDINPVPGWFVFFRFCSPLGKQLVVGGFGERAETSVSDLARGSALKTLEKRGDRGLFAGKWALFEHCGCLVRMHLTRPGSTAHGTMRLYLQG